METPKYYEFMNPTLQALREGGGTLTNEEIVNAVVTLMHLPDAVLECTQHGHNLSEVEYRIAWAKSHLKQAGYLTQNERGVWSLTSQGKDTLRINERTIVTANRKAYVARRKVKALSPPPQDVPEEAVQETSAAKEIEEEFSWKQQVFDALLALSPEVFERLSQRLLRESGFTQVEVTGRAGDGGIDGKGVLRLGGLINFQMVFQSKRYAGTVSAGIVRDFRGAMIGRADKGLIISTGTFSRDARAKAMRDGAPAIDLVDVQELAELLKKYTLGIKTVMVEKVEVDADLELLVPTLPCRAPDAAAVARAPRMTGLITLGVKRPGVRSAANPYAACEVAGSRNGVTGRTEALAEGESRWLTATPRP